MRKIYERAQAVLIWIGPDSDDHQAKTAIDSILTISDFLCRKLQIPVSKLGSTDNLYQRILTQYNEVLPVPNEGEFISEAVWKSLPKNWLFMLYLVSNFSSDARDVIYGLRGMMEFKRGSELLEPDYTKSVAEVYRDVVEAALINFQTTDVLLYLNGTEHPSWVPRWEVSMLFRNPFRFGKPLPWRPAGERVPTWAIDKDSDALTISGFIPSSIKFVETYNESIFGNAMINKQRDLLNDIWRRILKTIGDTQSKIPLTTNILTAAATSFSFGLDEKSNPVDEHILLERFVKYLRLVLDEEIYDKYIPRDVFEASEDADGRLFGKPVWDFTYPESSFFITENNLAGCSVASTRPGDVIFVAHGSTYPLVLRQHTDYFRIRGFAHVHGLMHGEQIDAEVRNIEIR
ncbi:heterokaryon incompatibility protein [Phlyctema vagabunda]|uniref:Heterokaryon incompatibility protein n=1 Tax=Phlyctema vagabunda TaxID=108571 RepID=A0ABR4PQ62_9HELO